MRGKYASNEKRKGLDGIVRLGYASEEAQEAEEMEETVEEAAAPTLTYTTVPAEEAAPVVPKKEIAPTIVSQGGVITGNIQSDGPITIFGMVEGNITSKDRVVITGKVAGDIQADEITMSSGAVQGNIFAQGGIVLQEGSGIIGDLEGENVVLGGKVEGNLTCRGHIEMKKTASVQGNITARSISVERGAMINGLMAITK